MRPLNRIHQAFKSVRKIRAELSNIISDGRRSSRVQVRETANLPLRFHANPWRRSSAPGHQDLSQRNRGGALCIDTDIVLSGD